MYKCMQLLTPAPCQLIKNVISFLDFQHVVNISPQSNSIVLHNPDTISAWSLSCSCLTKQDSRLGFWLQVWWSVQCHTNIMINVNQFVQEVLDRGHTTEDDGMKRRHPLLFSMAQLQAQVANTLQCLTTKSTHYLLFTCIFQYRQISTHWQQISKSKIKWVSEATHAVRPFVWPTPGIGREGSLSLRPSLMLGFEPQSGRIYTQR